MYKYYCEYNKNIYDGIKEFCQCERVNEEYMRTLLEEEKLKIFNNIIVALKVMRDCINKMVLNTYKKALSKI